MIDIMQVLDRKQELFSKDIQRFDDEITDLVSNSRFLVIGGGGSIGRAVSKEIFGRGARTLHVVDISENGLVELVRDVRSEHGYKTKDFDTFALDCGAAYFSDFMKYREYDYVLNLSALKHVRSENNVFSMKRMLETNIYNTLKTYQLAVDAGAHKYFCVSTDKAANPANFMGATKRAMEMCLMTHEALIPISTARFANVAFSNGSLLEGFKYRLAKNQPLTAPRDVKRFFVTEREAGIICLFSTLLGEKREIFFPYSENEIKLTAFDKIAENFLLSNGKKMKVFESEEEARNFTKYGDLNEEWPVYFFDSDTTGEKIFEEFYTNEEDISKNKYNELATIKFKPQKSKREVLEFFKEIEDVDLCNIGAKESLIRIFQTFIGSFEHVETHKYLNQRM